MRKDIFSLRDKCILPARDRIPEPPRRTHGHHFPVVSEAPGPVKVLDQYLSEPNSDAQNQAEMLALYWAHRGNGPGAKHSFLMWSQPFPLYKTRYIRALGRRGIGGCLPGTLEAPVLSERQAIENFSTDKG